MVLDILPALKGTGIPKTHVNRFLFLPIAGFSQLPFNLMVNWSYVRSTDCNCVSRSQNIFSCVDIPVMVCPTFRAVPFTNVQRQRFDDMSAGATALTAGEPAVNLHALYARTTCTCNRAGVPAHPRRHQRYSVQACGSSPYS